jgi:hypothetical protein
MGFLFQVVSVRIPQASLIYRVVRCILRRLQRSLVIRLLLYSFRIRGLGLARDTSRGMGNASFHHTAVRSFTVRDGTECGLWAGTGMWSLPVATQHLLVVGQ